MAVCVLDTGTLSHRRIRERNAQTMCLAPASLLGTRETAEVMAAFVSSDWNSREELHFLLY